MNINSYLTFSDNYNKKTLNKISKNNFTINLSQDNYNNKKNNDINNFLQYISEKKIFNPKHKFTKLKKGNILIGKKNNLVHTNVKMYERNSSPKITSISSSNYFSWDKINNYNSKKNLLNNNNIYGTKNKFICENYNKVFNNSINKNKDKYLHHSKRNKQEEIIEKINRLKIDCMENKINSFIDNGYSLKNYQNKIRNNFIWNKPNYKSAFSPKKTNNLQIYKYYSGRNSSNSLKKEIESFKKELKNDIIKNKMAIKDFSN